ncbi:hypothetical protein EYF80_030071 [Liparis tanakae]|uniref:Uncharacterized protein n=1 Tax=Liparis tanakae TaxID=230148 RepID=A0A4Z2H2L5_9TELE|nr:hypothetical protein EYF80_030071 [Liparis tanakae]
MSSNEPQRHAEASTQPHATPGGDWQISVPAAETSVYSDNGDRGARRSASGAASTGTSLKSNPEEENHARGQTGLQPDAPASSPTPRSEARVPGLQPDAPASSPTPRPEARIPGLEPDAPASSISPPSNSSRFTPARQHEVFLPLYDTELPLSAISKGLSRRRRSARYLLRPPSCMPSRAKTTMKRKRRKSKLMMDFMELRRDTTRFLSEFHRRALSTLMPNEAPGLIMSQITSRILPTITWRREEQEDKRPVSLREQSGKGDSTYPKIKAVEGGVEIIPGSEAVHLQGHLGQEQPQEHELGRVCVSRWTERKRL